MIWFYSDPHFDHTNIIRYCSRPFNSVEGMNTYLLDIYNRCVKSSDTVYFLGDMAFGRGSRRPRWWLDQLNGMIHYIKGSHDNGIRSASQGLNCVEVVQQKVIDIDGSAVLLIHDPSQVDASWKGWVIHGHTHNNTPVVKNRKINVSADAVGFHPVRMDFISKLIKKEDTGGKCNEISLPTSI